MIVTMVRRSQIARRISAMLYGLTGVLSLFSLLDKPMRTDPHRDSDMIRSDWDKVGADIYRAMMKIN